MGILQSSVPLGVMVGYSTAAVLITITGYELSWRIAFAVIFFLTSFTALFFFFTDNKNVDILHYEKEIQKGLIVQAPQTKRRHRDSEVTKRENLFLVLSSFPNDIFGQIADSLSIVSHSSSYGEGCWEMFKQFGVSKNYIIFVSFFFVLILSFFALFLNLFSADSPSPSFHLRVFRYLYPFLYRHRNLILVYRIFRQIRWCFSFYCNGHFQLSCHHCSYLWSHCRWKHFRFTCNIKNNPKFIFYNCIFVFKGGYKGKHRITALKYCTSVGLAALIFSIPIGFVTEFWQIAIMIWMLLCFGGALVPSGTGLCLSCLPKQYHSTCSSLS